MGQGRGDLYCELAGSLTAIPFGSIKLTGVGLSEISGVFVPLPGLKAVFFSSVVSCIY